MKKLNNREIEALASKIASELRKIEDINFSKKREIKLDKFNKTKLGKALKLVNDSYKKINKSELTNRYQIDSLAEVDKPKYFNNNTIEQSIILAQLEQPDLTTLINAVKAEFK